MKLYIKNMVCNRCLLAVESVLKDNGIEEAFISLGEVDFANLRVTNEQIETLGQEFEHLGFELINDKKSRLIEKIKSFVITLVQSQDGLEHVKLSDYLTKHIAYEYNYLSSLFSSAHRPW